MEAQKTIECELNSRNYFLLSLNFLDVRVSILKIYVHTARIPSVVVEILKRFQVSPVSPAKLLFVEFMIYVIDCIISMLTLFPIAVIFWKIKIHGSFLLFVGGWLLTMVSTLSIGLLVGGIAKNRKHASVIAILLPGKLDGTFLVCPSPCVYWLCIYPVLVAVWHSAKAYFLKVRKSHQFYYGRTSCVLCHLPVFIEIPGHTKAESKKNKFSVYVHSSSWTYSRMSPG